VISPTDSISPSLRRRLVTLAVALPLVFLVSGCSSGTSSAESPAANEVQFTSASGLLTINVPKTWTENTVQAQALMDAMGSDVGHVEGGWLLSGNGFSNGSSVNILTHRGIGNDQTAIANETFAQLALIFGDATASYSTVTTRDGFTFERGDFSLSANGTTATAIELIAIIHGVGVEIAITLINDDVALEDEVIHAVETLVVN